MRAVAASAPEDSRIVNQTGYPSIGVEDGWPWCR